MHPLNPAAETGVAAGAFTPDAGRLPTCGTASRPPLAASLTCATSLRRNSDTSMGTAEVADTGSRSLSVPSRRLPRPARGCHPALIPTPAQDSPSGNAVTTRWTGFVFEAGPTGAEAAGAGAEVAIPLESPREVVADTVAAKAGGSLRLGNVSLS